MWRGTTKLILTAATALLWLTSGAVQAAPLQQRGWELVSPSEKRGNDVIASSSRTHAAAGEAPGLPAAVAFASLGGFADTAGGGIATEYLAQRTAQPGTSGWSTHAITPPQEPMSITAVAQQLDPAYELFSPDLSKAIFRAWSPLTDVPNVAGVENLYVREDLRTAGHGSYRLLTSAPAPLPPITADVQRPFLAAATDDLAHVLLESQLALTQDTTGGNPTLFKVDGAALRLLAGSGDCPGFLTVSNLPCSAAGLGAMALHQTSDALSADGTRVVFTSPVTFTGNVSTGGTLSRLFQLDDRGTAATADDALVQLNASELATPEQPLAARFQAASADGARVYFTSAERLTEDAPAGGGLYLWEHEPDPTTGHHLTFIAPGGLNVLALGASHDGRRVYFAAPSQLLAGGPSVTENGVYLWERDVGGVGGALSFVAALSVGDARSNADVNTWNLVPSTTRVTPDGRTLAFQVADEIGVGAGHAHGACIGNPNVTSSGICGQLYVYRADASAPLAPALACASCQPSGAPTGANAWMSARAGAGAAQLTAKLSHALSDDGRRLFFSSAAALVPEDGNGQVDVYEYDVPSGTVRLLSSGRDPADSWFLDASANGDDVFFVTREQLVGWDVDRAYDLYDARVGGGVPEPPAPPPACSGDACRGAGSPAPPFAALGSAALVLPPAAARPRQAGRRRAARKACRRGFVRRKVRGRRRCVRRRQQR